jgi:non-homologous end joining protein Ku
LEADDKTFIIKPGYRGNIRYLSQLLHQKHGEHLKEMSNKPKRNKQSMSQQNANNLVDNIQHSIQSSSTSSSRQNHATPSS